MTPEKIAIIADVHGNRWALEAVLQDIQSRDVKTILNLGDSLYGPLDPRATAESLMRHDNLHTINGNEDLILFSNQEPDSPTLAYVREQLTDTHLNWLSSQPAASAWSEEIYLCHGTPRSDEEYLLESVHATGISLKRVEEIAKSLEKIPHRLVLCGHSHQPHHVRLPSGTMVVNPGSVGLPAYVDELPIPHRMETGSPHARYAIIQPQGKDWLVEHIAVPYDWQSASAKALENQRSDWAKWLATGRGAI